jgi:hypothetical protein
MKVLLFLLVFIFSFYNIHALDVTARDAEAYITAESNRSHYYADISLTCAIELENMFRLKGGIALGAVPDTAAIGSFINAEYLPFSGIPLSFSASYIYNGLPGYKAHTHSILPFVSYNTWRAGISLGSNFRFTSFFGENAQFESIFSFSGYFNFINNDSLLLGIGFGNFSDFMAKNIGAYSLSLFADIRLDDRWSIINNMELMQSGGDGFSTTFYGFAWRAGVRFSW